MDLKRRENPSDGQWAASRGCGLVRLAKSGSAVGTPPLPQGQTEENAQGEEDNGTQDPQTGEVLLQHPHPANKSTVLSLTSTTVQVTLCCDLLPSRNHVVLYYD